MQRLITDASKLKSVQKELGITVDANSMSFGNIVNAISVMQESMGIAGTTAKEAGITIAGSIGSMKAAWQNLITGIADDNANFEQLVNNFVTTLVGDGTETNLGVLGNILPRFEVALSGVGSLVSKLAPVIGEQLPVLTQTLLPMIIESTMSLISAVGDVLPSLILSLSDAVMKMSSELSKTLGDGLGSSESLSAILAATETLIMSIGEFIIQNAPMLFNSAVEIVLALAKGLGDSTSELLPTIVDVIVEIADMITNPSTLSDIFDAALEIILKLGLGLIDAIPELVDAAVSVIVNLVEFLTKPENMVKIRAVGIELIIALGGALISSIPSLLESVGKIILAIVDNFRETDWGELGTQLVAGLKGGIEHAWANLKEWFTGLFGDLIGVAKKILRISSPSKAFEEIGRFTDEGLANGIEKNSDKVYKQMEKIVNKIKKYFDEIQTYFDTSMDIAELEYEMWELTEGLDASDAEKAAKKIELLNKQLADQKEIVDASNVAYQEMVKLYGEGSIQAMEYKKQLLEEQVEYQKMQNELNETNQSYKELSRTQNGWAKVAVNAVKAVSNAIKETAEVSDTAINKSEETTNKIGENIKELIDLFTSGKAKTNISNARDLRGVSYG